MSDSGLPLLPSGRRLSDFLSHLVEMPRWHKSLLTLATFLFCGGFAGQMGGFLSSAQTKQDAPAATLGSSYVQVDRQTSTQQPKETWTQWLSPHATRVGLSFVAAFVIGWLARAFVKMVTLFAALAASIMLGLSYFRIVNVDFSAAEHQYASTVEWLLSQTQHLAGTLIHRLPSSFSSGFGFFIGFRRRR